MTITTVGITQPGEDSKTVLPGPISPKPNQPNHGLGHNFLASLFTEYETDSLPKHLYCKVGNQMNGPGFSSFKHMQFAGS